MHISKGIREIRNDHKVIMTQTHLLSDILLIYIGMISKSILQCLTSTKTPMLEDLDAIAT